MSVSRVTAWRQDQPFRDGPYVRSGNRVALGSFYAPAFVDVEA